MERIERISNKHEQEERKENGERERVSKGQGKEKENHFFSLLSFTSFPLPCPRAIQLFNLFVLLWLAGGLPSQRAEVPLLGIGWYRLEYRLERRNIFLDAQHKIQGYSRWCNPMPHVNIHQEM